MDKHEPGLSALHWVLAKRLPYSRSWENVEVMEKKRTFEIKWVDPKWPDPDDKETFCSLSRPLSARSLDAEVDRQIVKYVKEKYGVELDVG